MDADLDASNDAIDYLDTVNSADIMDDIDEGDISINTATNKPHPGYFNIPEIKRNVFTDEKLDIICI